MCVCIVYFLHFVYLIIVSKSVDHFLSSHIRHIGHTKFTYAIDIYIYIFLCAVALANKCSSKMRENESLEQEPGG